MASWVATGLGRSPRAKIASSRGSVANDRCAVAWFPKENVRLALKVSGERSRTTGRTNRLDHEIAEARFPSGIGVPSAVVLVLTLLLAAASGFFLTPTATKPVPGAVVASQEHFVEATARSLAASATEAVLELRFAVTESSAGWPRNPGELLGTLGELYPRWRGLAVVESANRALVAARGEPIPLEALDQVVVREASIRPVARPGGRVLMMAAIPLPADDGARLLVASTEFSSSQFPLDERLAQSVLMVTGDGSVLDSRGPVPAPDDRVTGALIRRAATESAAGRAGSEVDLLAGAGPAQPPSAQANRTAAVVAYAPLASSELSGKLGLSLISVAHVPVADVESPVHRPAPAIALAVLSLLGFVLVRMTVVGPVHRLRADALAVAAGCVGREVRTSGVREVRRIAAVVEQCRSGTGTRPRRRRFGLTARQAIGVCAVAMLVWSGLVTWTIGMSAPDVPDVVVRERGMAVSRIADSVGRSLNGGMAELKLLARLAGQSDANAMRQAMGRLVSREARYRSVYLVDATGRTTVQAGRAPLRAAETPPPGEGFRQYNTDGRLPVIFAHVPTLDGKGAVIGEFDIEHLSELLRQSVGRVRVVDPGFRTIADTEGYRAFQMLSGEPLRRSAGDALAGKPTAAMVDGQSGRYVVASAAVGGAGTVAALRWGVVAEQPAGALGLPGNELRRRSLAVGIASAAIALLLLGWHEFAVTRPLRRSAALAERFGDGDLDSPIYPLRQDQIGTITSCLETCRKSQRASANKKLFALRES